MTTGDLLAGLHVTADDTPETAQLKGSLTILDVLTSSNPSLRRRILRDRDLARVQQRREIPAKITQAFQLIILRDLYPKHLGDDTAAHTPGWIFDETLSA